MIHPVDIAATGFLPPSFVGHPYVYAFTIFGMMLTELLAAEWLHRLAWSLIEAKRPWKHPVTISRLILILLLVGLLMRLSPDVALTMLWPEISSDAILWLQWVDRIADAASAGPMLLAWIMGVLGGAMIDWQLSRLPVPIDMWPNWKQVRRPARICGIILAIALTVTFLR